MLKKYEIGDEVYVTTEKSQDEPNGFKNRIAVINRIIEPEWGARLIDVEFKDNKEQVAGLYVNDIVHANLISKGNGNGITAVVSILGTEYTIQTRKVSEDEYMKKHSLAGYCCEESKRIVIADMSEKEYFELDEAEQKLYYKKTLRHELLHAFLNESGLSDDASVPAGAWAKHEEMVDWFAIQSPKIYKIFAELDIL